MSEAGETAATACAAAQAPGLAVDRSATSSAAARAPACAAARLPTAAACACRSWLPALPGRGDRGRAAGEPGWLLAGWLLAGWLLLEEDRRWARRGVVSPAGDSAGG